METIKSLYDHTTSEENYKLIRCCNSVSAWQHQNLCHCSRRFVHRSVHQKKNVDRKVILLKINVKKGSKINFFRRFLCAIYLICSRLQPRQSRFADAAAGRQSLFQFRSRSKQPEFQPAPLVPSVIQAIFLTSIYRQPQEQTSNPEIIRLSMY